MASKVQSQPKMSPIQRQIQQDWANREYIEVMTCNIKRISDFLNAFGEIKNHKCSHFQRILIFVRKHLSDSSCRAKLSILNERLTTLERRVEYIEARVSYQNMLF